MSLNPALCRELLLLRHGKSDWSQVSSDFQRPLKGRGRRAAERMGLWIVEQQLIPDQILSSPAVRALSTARMVSRSSSFDSVEIRQDQRIYEANLSDLLKVLADLEPAAQRVMLVGHNPGLEDLLIYLAANQPPPSDKLMPTAALAILHMPADWSTLASHCAKLVSITRPNDLPDTQSGN
jgi:phosphohistidine phosphatase